MSEKNMVVKVANKFYYITIHPIFYTVVNF